MSLPWYRAGSVAVTNGSKIVTGTGTAFSSVAQIKTGDALALSDSTFYEVASVESDTSLTLVDTYAGSTLAGQAYMVIPLTGTSLSNAELAGKVSALLTKWINREDEVIAWQAGTATGGPNSDGQYPLTDPTGTVNLVECPAKTASRTGTASAADLTTSATDTTAGRVLKVGDFGLGVTNTAEYLDFDTLVSTGFYHVKGANRPNPAEVDTMSWWCAVEGLGAAAIKQTATPYNSTRQIFTRTSFGGVWSAWREVYTEENILGTVSQTAGVPTGAIIERGSNANGEYVKFADGTMICTLTVADITLSVAPNAFYIETSRSLPATFIESAPTTCVNANLVTDIGLPLLARVWNEPPKGWAIGIINGSTATITKITRLKFIAIGRWF